VFEKHLGLTIHVVSKPDKFERLNTPCLAYDKNYTGRKPGVVPHTLLLESGIRDLHPKTIIYQGLPALFPVGEGILPFDIFAAVFYLLTRYEEYLPYTADSHGRFLPENSILDKQGCLDIPLVDYWLEKFKSRLTEIYPSLTFMKSRFQYQSTIDVDNAFKYKHKGFGPTLFALARDFLFLRYSTFRERLSAVTGKSHDPFDVYRVIEKETGDFGFPLLFFMQVGHYGKQDKNFHKQKKEYKMLLNELAGKHAVGIHPSYKSNAKPALLEKEIQYLEDVLQKKVHDSRQHYLMLNIPYTYNQLIKMGIKRDYSMGYASKVGFRAGTSHPFRFYNLHLEQEQDLEIIPFCVMDRTLKDYLKLNTDEATAVIKKLVGSISKTGGVFTSLWHNEIFSDEGEWLGWGKVYPGMLKFAKEHEEK